MGTLESLRITVWIFRFVSNAKKRKKTKGVLTTKEIKDAETYWIKVAQDEATKEGNHSAIASKLGLEPDKKGVLRCKGRIIGEHPIYIPRNHHFSSLVVSEIVSDNAKTFVAMAKLLRKLKHSQVVNDYLARREIHWKFNLARSPWWGGFFERMVGLMKNAFRKAIGKANFTFKPLKEVLLEVEITA